MQELGFIPVSHDADFIVGNTVSVGMSPGTFGVALEVLELMMLK